MVFSRVARVPHIGEPVDTSFVTDEVKILAVPVPEAKQSAAALWMIILAAIIGVIILLLLIFLLYKVRLIISIFLLFSHFV